MSWSNWGLAPLADDALPEVVLRTPRRWLALGVDRARARITDELSERWFVSAVVIEAPHGDLRPAPGDVVVWRADPWDDFSRPSIWGGPTSVLSVADTDDGRIEVCCLEDMQHHDWDTVADVDDLSMLVMQDHAMLPGEVAVLSRRWHIYLCPRCGGRAKEIVYGLPSADLFERDDVALGGCVISENALNWECASCRTRF